MLEYITYEDYLKRFPNDRKGFDVDKFSRLLVMEFLDVFGCTDINPTEGCNSTDIIFTDPNAVRTAVEIKDRSWSYASSDFKDHFCELVKVQSLVKRKQKQEFSKIWLISLFKDNCFTITTDLEHNIKEKRVMKCPETTTLDKHDLVDKECLLYNQDYKYYFCIIYNNLSNKFNFYFSKQPINTERLNQQEALLVNNLF